MHKSDRYLNTDIHIYEQTDERIRLLQLSKKNKLSNIRDEEGKKPKAIINCSYFSDCVLGRNQGDMYNNTHDQEGFYDLVFLNDGTYQIGNFKSWDYVENVLAGFSVAGILILNGNDVALYSEAIVKADKLSAKNPQTAIAVKKDGKVVLIVSEGRNSNDVGLTGYQLRTYLKTKYDIELLALLDGGGSSEMIVDGTIKNYLSDLAERSMWNGLALIETENNAQTEPNEPTEEETTTGEEDERMALKYIDISKYQTDVDYQKVAKNIDGVILRCGYTGYGTGKTKQKDPLFEQHYQGFKNAGVPIGVYWYSCASTNEEAKKEAELTLEYIKGKTIELPVWFDTEDTHHQKALSKTALSEIARTFCETIEKAGYYTGIYASTSWLNNQLNMDSLSDIDVWVAHYGVSKPTYIGTYGMWQYTSSGSVNGISGNVDMNYAYKDYQAIIKKAGLNNLEETDIEALQEKISSLTAELETANKTIQSREIEIIKLEDELSKAQSKIDQIKKIVA